MPGHYTKIGTYRTNLYRVHVCDDNNPHEWGGRVYVGSAHHARRACLLDFVESRTETRYLLDRTIPRILNDMAEAGHVWPALTTPRDAISAVHALQEDYRQHEEDELAIRHPHLYY